MSPLRLASLAAIAAMLLYLGYNTFSSVAPAGGAFELSLSSPVGGPRRAVDEEVPSAAVEEAEDLVEPREHMERKPLARPRAPRPRKKR